MPPPPLRSRQNEKGFKMSYMLIGMPFWMGGEGGRGVKQQSVHYLKWEGNKDRPDYIKGIIAPSHLLFILLCLKTYFHIH